MDFSVCDCHVHVFDPKRFAYVTPRRFTPAEATVLELRSYLKNTGVTNMVLVQPSVYGEDNSCLIHALNQLGANARGVAVISNKTTLEELNQLQAAGVQGARINLVVDRLDDPNLALNKLIEIDQHIPLGWHIQLHASLQILDAVSSYMRQSNRIYVLDHMGLPNVTQGVQSDAWTQLLKLMDSRQLYVKISAPYLYSQNPNVYSDLIPFVRTLLKTHPDRLLWGSNWPHTQGTSRNVQSKIENVEAFREIDNVAWLKLCKQWFGNKAIAALSKNSENLYGF